MLSKPGNKVADLSLVERTLQLQVHRGCPLFLEPQFQPHLIAGSVVEIRENLVSVDYHLKAGKIIS